MTTTPAIRCSCLALAATLLLGTAAAEEASRHDRAALKGSLETAASSCRDQAAIVGRDLAARALAELATAQRETSAVDVRVVAVGRDREERS